MASTAILSETNTDSTGLFLVQLYAWNVQKEKSEWKRGRGSREREERRGEKRGRDLRSEREREREREREKGG
jgi:hypothetical protein